MPGQPMTNTPEEMILKVKKIDSNAELPKRQSSDAAGYDISSNEDVIIPAFSYKLVSTGLSFTVPYGTYGQLAPRSGLSCKGITVGAGVIDRDYTGHVKVLLFNTTDKNYNISNKDRIAQLIIKKISLPDIVEVDVLSESSRGSCGFGSTGI